MDKKVKRTLVVAWAVAVLVSGVTWLGLNVAFGAGTGEATVKEEVKPAVVKRDPIETAAFALGAAIVTGIACVAAGVAVGRVGAAALGAVSERPELLGRTLIFVGLAEGIAIYGLIVAIMLMGYLK